MWGKQINPSPDFSMKHQSLQSTEATKIKPRASLHLNNIRNNWVNMMLDEYDLDLFVKKRLWYFRYMNMSLAWYSVITWNGVKSVWTWTWFNKWERKYANFSLKLGHFVYLVQKNRIRLLIILILQIPLRPKMRFFPKKILHLI